MEENKKARVLVFLFIGEFDLI